jgi:urea transport system ATP-binding protein
MRQFLDRFRQPEAHVAIDPRLIFSVEHVSVAYGRSTAVHDVSLGAEQGEVVCVMGRNGAGKTTLLKSIIGLLPVSSGRIVFGGRDVTRRSPFQRARTGIGYVPQGRGIFPQLSVLENLLIGLESAGGKETGQLDEVYATFPVLKEMEGRVAGVLSGGQQQQLAIGRALMGRPWLLLLDEPTEGIQPNIVEEIEAVIGTLRTRMTILLVEQFLGFALANADFCYVMERGAVTIAGKPADLSESRLHEALAI